MLKKLWALLYLWWHSYCFKHKIFKTAGMFTMYCPGCSHEDRVARTKKADVRLAAHKSKANKAIDILEGK